MKILKKTTVVAKPAAKAMMKARAEEMFKAGKNKPKKLVATATLQKGFVSIDKKTGKETKSPMSAPVKLKMKSITEKEFNK
jgi:hypothetical protein